MPRGMQRLTETQGANQKIGSKQGEGSPLQFYSGHLLFLLWGKSLRIRQGTIPIGQRRGITSESVKTQVTKDQDFDIPRQLKLQGQDPGE